MNHASYVNLRLALRMLMDVLEIITAPSDMPKVTSIFSLCLLIAGSIVSANAATLTLDSGFFSSFARSSAPGVQSSDPLVLSDTDTPGLIYYSGSVDGWIISAALGYAAETETGRELSLLIGAQSSEAGQLNIQFSQDFFGSLSGIAYTALGGVVAQGDGNSLTYRAFSNSGDLASPATFGAGEFQFNDASSLSLLGSYFLTQEIVIIHEDAGVSSIDAHLNAVATPDSGSTLILMGCALLALEGLRRRFSLQTR